MVNNPSVTVIITSCTLHKVVSSAGQGISQVIWPKSTGIIINKLLNVKVS